MTGRIWGPTGIQPYSRRGRDPTRTPLARPYPHPHTASRPHPHAASPAASLPRPRRRRRRPPPSLRPLGSPTTSTFRTLRIRTSSSLRVSARGNGRRVVGFVVEVLLRDPWRWNVRRRLPVTRVWASRCLLPVTRPSTCRLVLAYPLGISGVPSDSYPAPAGVYPPGAAFGPSGSTRCPPLRLLGKGKPCSTSTPQSADPFAAGSERRRSGSMPLAPAGLR